MDLTQSKSYDSASSDTSSPFLRKRRARQNEQERQLQMRLNRMASAESSDSLSINSSFSYDDNSMESSLISFAMSRSSIKEKELRKELKWEKIPVEFSFGLLTSLREAPPDGKYAKKKSKQREDGSLGASASSTTSTYLLEKSSILKFIMKKVGEVSKSAVKHRSGNVITKARTPYICYVMRDDSYKPPKGREGVVRSFIKAIVPIEISDVNVEELTRSSKIIAKVVIKQALIEGIQRKIFEPLIEDDSYL